MSRDCIFKVTTLAGQVDAGTVTLDGDQITAVATSGYRTLMDHVLAMGVIRSSKIKIAKWQDDPTAWFEALPYQYSGSYLRAGIVVSKVKKYSEDQPRDEHGMWTSEGGGVSASDAPTNAPASQLAGASDPKVGDAIRSWQAHPEAIQAEAGRIVTTGATPSADTPAGIIVNGIRNGETIHGDMYRGVYSRDPVGAAQVQSLKALKPGDTFQMTEPQSFTTNLGTATGFAARTNDPNGRIVLQVASGAKGMSFDHLDAKDAEVYTENEVLSNGRFEVTGRHDWKSFGGNHYDILEVKQLGVL